MFNVAPPFVPFSSAQLGLRSSKHQDFSPSNELKITNVQKSRHWSLIVTSSGSFFSPRCRSRVWTASCGLLWTWNLTYRCLGRGRPGWTRSCTCCGSWRPSWRRRGSRARESCQPGSEKTNGSGSSSSRLRNKWVDVLRCKYMRARRRSGQDRIIFEYFLLRLTRSSCRRSVWKRCWGQQPRTSTRSEARAAKRSPRSRPSGETRAFASIAPLNARLIPPCCSRPHPVPPAGVFSERRWPSSHEQRPASPTCRLTTCREAFQSVPPQSYPALPHKNEVHNWWRILNDFNKSSRKKNTLNSARRWRNKLLKSSAFLTCIVYVCQLAIALLELFF